MSTEVRDDGTRRCAGGGASADQSDGAAHPGGLALPPGVIRPGGSIHPGPRRPRPAGGFREHRHQASPSRVRQPVVPDRGVGQHGPQHRPWWRHGTGAVVRGRAVGAQDRARRWHAEAIGADERKEGEPDAEFRGVLFWVNLARKDKQVDPSAQVVQPAQIPVRHEGDASRVLVGDGSPVRLGTPALILDVELPTGGQATLPVPPGSRASPTCSRARLPWGQPPSGKAAAAGPAGSRAEFAVTDAAAGTRLLP